MTDGMKIEPKPELQKLILISNVWAYLFVIDLERIGLGISINETRVMPNRAWHISQKQIFQ